MTFVVDLHKALLEAFATIKGLPAATLPGSRLPSEAIRRRLVRHINEMLPNIEALAASLSSSLAELPDEGAHLGRWSKSFVSGGQAMWQKHVDALRLECKESSKYAGAASFLLDYEDSQTWQCIHCSSVTDQAKIACETCRCRRQRSAKEIIDRSVRDTQKNSHLGVEERRSEFLRAEISAAETAANTSQQMAALKLSTFCGVFVSPTFTASGSRTKRPPNSPIGFALPSPRPSAKLAHNLRSGSARGPPLSMSAYPHSLSTDSLVDLRRGLVSSSDFDLSVPATSPPQSAPIPIGPGPRKHRNGSNSSSSPGPISSSAPGDLWKSDSMPTKTQWYDSYGSSPPLDPARSYLSVADAGIREPPSPATLSQSLASVALGESSSIDHSKTFGSLDSLQVLAAASDAAGGGFGSATPQSLAKVSASLHNSGSQDDFDSA
eukprot:CAMPEP_0198319766 /NCGR_PEP_ID=MMETSP1450-20131203/8835_1 /TAXON_ID=753684 ORGANISM="Madagascaria erythrocladiodes, Strain CCMP3234" /NCGR_SAMPLE_ID=MMETSP1450 /ASSEMBLY_ACC=CAM_ASM_001115 /LENGTH=435 /DNA_ID=CAMNT_0044023179 /DNA_START=30 /DNA_END=1333 /DNA_ORIENTATION=-